jgi:hypothetical protein
MVFFVIACACSVLLGMVSLVVPFDLSLLLVWQALQA